MAALDDALSPFDGLDSDSIQTIFSSLDGLSLLHVQLVARWAHDIGNRNQLWHRLCESDLGLTPPPPGYPQPMREPPIAAWVAHGDAPFFTLQECYWRLRNTRPEPIHYLGTITDGGMDASGTPDARARYHFTNLFKANKWESYCSAAPTNVTCIGACIAGDRAEVQHESTMFKERRVMVAALAYPVHRLLGWTRGVQTLQSLSTTELRGLFLEAAAEAMVVPMMLMGGAPGAHIDQGGPDPVWGWPSDSEDDSEAEDGSSTSGGGGGGGGAAEQMHPDGQMLNDEVDGGIPELSSMTEFRAFVEIVRERREADTPRDDHEMDEGGGEAEGGGEGQASSTGGAAVEGGTDEGVGGGDDLTANVQWNSATNAWQVPPWISASVYGVRVSREGEYSCPLRTGAILFSNAERLPRPDHFPDGRTTPAELLASGGEPTQSAGQVGSAADTGTRGWDGSGKGKERAAGGSASGSGASAPHPHAAVLEEAEARSLEGVVRLSEEGRLPPITNITYQRCPVCAEDRANVGQTKTYRTPFPYRGRSYVAEPAEPGTKTGAAEEGLTDAHEDCVTVTLEFARGGNGNGNGNGNGGGGEFELAAWFQYTCPVACREHCPPTVSDRLDIKFQKPRAAKFVAVKLVDSEDRMAELGDNHDDPNIDVAYVAFKGKTMRKSTQYVRHRERRMARERKEAEQRAKARADAGLPP